MRIQSYLGYLIQLGTLLYRFRTPILFWLYILAMMAYAYRWMPE
ncbi:hypothetical protein [Robiginitalea sp. SC105]|nr:hypothetical protein [Robiginitalea sp. SC105]